MFKFEGIFICIHSRRCWSGWRNKFFRVIPFYILKNTSSVFVYICMYTEERCMELSSGKPQQLALRFHVSFPHLFSIFTFRAFPLAFGKSSSSGNGTTTEYRHLTCSRLTFISVCCCMYSPVGTFRVSAHSIFLSPEVVNLFPLYIFWHEILIWQRSKPVIPSPYIYIYIQ